MKGITILSDLPEKNELYTFYENIGWNSYLKLSPEKLILAMKASWFSVYAYSEKNLVGTARVISDGHINAYLCGLGVLDKYRSKGIAKEMMSVLIEKCKVEELNLQLFCESHLVKFYEELGFEEFASGMMLENRKNL